MVGERDGMNDHVPFADFRKQALEQGRPDVYTRGMGILGVMLSIKLAVRSTIETLFYKIGLGDGEFDVLATLLCIGPP